MFQLPASKICFFAQNLLNAQDKMLVTVGAQGYEATWKSLQFIPILNQMWPPADVCNYSMTLIFPVTRLTPDSVLSAVVLNCQLWNNHINIGPILCITFRECISERNHLKFNKRYLSYSATLQKSYGISRTLKIHHYYPTSVGARHDVDKIVSNLT